MSRCKDIRRTVKSGVCLVAIGIFDSIAIARGAGHVCFPFFVGHIEMPHQLYDTARIVPVLDRSDVGVVNPVGWRETDVNEVVAVHGRILACEFIDFLGTSVVPVDICHNAGNRLLAILVQEIGIQVLGSIC